jgi:hypothetical protein
MLNSGNILTVGVYVDSRNKMRYYALRASVWYAQFCQVFTTIFFR